MKRPRAHRVPLSQPSLNVLAQAGEMSDGSGLVFPSSREGRPLSDMTHRKLLRDLGIRATDGRYATPHGFRSSFRDWCSEQTDTPEEVAEAALAHARKDATEAAYARSDLFDRRRHLMEQWAEYATQRSSI